MATLARCTSEPRSTSATWRPSPGRRRPPPRRAGRVGGVGAQRLGGERPDLAGGVRALQRGQVDHADREVDRPRLGGGLDGAGAELAARCSAPTWSTPGRPCRKARRGLRSSQFGQVRPPTSLSPSDLSRRTPELRDLAHGRRFTSVDVLVVDHPLAQSRLTVMRDEGTDSANFRGRCTNSPRCWCTSDVLPVSTSPCGRPSTGAPGAGAGAGAGLGMVDSALGLLPESPMPSASPATRTPTSRGR